MWRKLLIVCVVIAGSAACPASAFPAADANLADAANASLRIEAASSNTSRRVALVIGNQRYADVALPNAKHDARAMSATLAQLGYTVLLHEDLDAHGMAQAIASFQENLAGGGEALFYFAGHGLQVAGKTLLLSLDADSRVPPTLLTKAIDLDAVLAAMSIPRAGRRNLVILDTCLNNPFDARDTGNSPRKPLPDHTQVAYATAPGALASDGNERHGRFTGTLLNTLTISGIAPIEALARAADQVRRTSQGRQLPWIASSWPEGAPAMARAVLPPVPTLAGREPDDMEHAGISRGVMPKDSAEQVELTFWESIKNSDQAGDYEAYLQSYPNGRFAALAKTRIGKSVV